MCLTKSSQAGKLSQVASRSTAGIHIHSGPYLSVSEPYRFLPATIQDTQDITEQFYLTPNIGVKCTAMQYYVDNPLLDSVTATFRNWLPPQIPPKCVHLPHPSTILALKQPYPILPIKHINL